MNLICKISKISFPNRNLVKLHLPFGSNSNLKFCNQVVIWLGLVHELISGAGVGVGVVKITIKMKK